MAGPEVQQEGESAGGATGASPSPAAESPCTACQGMEGHAIIAGYGVLGRGGGQDQPHLGPALSNHGRQFGRPPRLLAADRGMASAENERLAKQAGVRHVALPHVGKAPPGRRAEERGRRFREGYRFRAGIEGRIHALKRDFGLRRCRYRGERGFGRWVGWGILAHNLAKVAGAAARP